MVICDTYKYMCQYTCRQSGCSEGPERPILRIASNLLLFPESPRYEVPHLGQVSLDAAASGFGGTLSVPPLHCGFRGQKFPDFCGQKWLGVEARHFVWTLSLWEGMLNVEAWKRGDAAVGTDRVADTSLARLISVVINDNIAEWAVRTNKWRKRAKRVPFRG